MLWAASEGDPSKIPQHYVDHLSHTWSDGDISMVSLLPKFESFSELEDFELEEAIDLLGKVNPNDWPNLEDIDKVSVDNLLKIYDEDTLSFDYVEDNLGLGEKVTNVLKHTIESVFGEPISTVRSKSGEFPGSNNNFLQETDGTFSGIFRFEEKEFNFEITPTESGWVCTYRMSAKSLDSLPPLPKTETEKDKKQIEYRKTRARGW
jgi:predicted Zn-dependent protease with MMP-like domain